MGLMDDEEIRGRIHSGKDHLLNQVRRALAEAGLHDYEVQSIRLNVKHVRSCPDGRDPVWGPVTQPDGSVVYQWVCP
jgi:hypothetical protein